MCNLNELTTEQKQYYHELLNEYAQKMGGRNFFLQMLETVRERDRHPLMASSCRFSFEKGFVTWDKVIFKDKLELLLAERVYESKRGNLLPKKEEGKHYKKVLNLVRTLSPITFTVTPKQGEGFTFSAFEIVDSETTKLNPIFDAIFFCSFDTVKQLLNGSK